MLYRNLICSILFLIFSEINLFAYDWEPAVQTSINPNTYRNNDLNYCFNIAADNFGMHFTGLYGGRPGHIDYYFLDNYGNILQNITNINTIATASAVCSFEEIIYIAVTDNSYTNKIITLYAKPNTYPYGNFSQIAQYTISTSQIHYIDMCADNYGLHIVLSENEPGTNGDGVYYLNYKLDVSAWAAYGMIPITTNPPGSGGMGARVAVSNVNGLERVHISFSRAATFNQRIVTNDIRIFRNPDSYILDAEQPTYEWGSSGYEGFWGSVAVDPRQNGKMYVLASFRYGGQFGIDGKLKHKAIGTEGWQSSTPIWCAYATCLFQCPLSIYYDGYIDNKMSVLYGEGDVVKQKYFNITEGQFEATANELLSGGFNSGQLMKADSQGVFMLAYKTYPQAFFMRRQPRDIRNDISYNALWTGNTYLNAPNPPYIHTNGANIDAMPNSVTTLRTGTILYVDPGNYLVKHGNAQIILEPNAQIIFLGNSSLQMDGGTMQFDNGAGLTFNDGASISANGVTFSGVSSHTWNGITLNNVASCTIQNCTFNNASTSLTFYNSSVSSASYLINTNIFNVSATSGRGISGRNIYNLNCQNNQFNLSPGTIGALIQDSYNPREPEPSQPLSLLKFINNYFTGGYIQLFIGGYASNNIPVYVYGNVFNSNANGWCFVGRMVTGDVKYNTMTRSNYNYAMGLWQSNPNLANNTVTNQSGNSMYLSAAYPIIAPTVNSENDLLWFGGSNRFTASYGDDIHFSGSKPLLDEGNNCFTISNSSYYHLYGYIPTTETQYFARRNSWSGSGGNVPRAYLYNYNQNPVSVVYQPTIVCNEEIQYGSFLVYELGDGIFDTVWVSDNYSGIQAPVDEILYSQAAAFSASGEYFDAIINLKNIIDNYPESAYLYSSLYDLYACYQGLDTSDQTHRDIIFGDLKFYLENKIQQYQDNAEFVSIAYNLILMCETMIENYNEAMTGYEFISLYHPDPEQRLLASMDYGEIQTLLNGMGGGVSNNVRKTKRNVLKIMDDKPYTKIVKDIYVKASRELKSKLKDESSRDDKSVIQQKVLIERARENINLSKSLTKDERDQRRMEDIKVLIKENSHNQTDNTNIVPSSYSLHQNYPNPFNPVTTIKFDLPKDVNVTIKVYDLLGREVTRLVNNELRKAGRYEVKWNAANYASGVYVYRIEARQVGSSTVDYISTKKMVLVK